MQAAMPVCFLDGAGWRGGAQNLLAVVRWGKVIPFKYEHKKEVCEEKDYGPCHWQDEEAKAAAESDGGLIEAVVQGAAVFCVYR
jgi:hypothetical protein